MSKDGCLPDGVTHGDIERAFPAKSGEQYGLEAQYRAILDPVIQAMRAAAANEDLSEEIRHDLEEYANGLEDMIDEKVREAFEP
ncbi:MAG: hypothetical protein KIS92_02635 [Planctomycetota bacterium]|nr:hypothetical protein [Planctomycetota bacterium]